MVSEPGWLQSEFFGSSLKDSKLKSLRGLVSALKVSLKFQAQGRLFVTWWYFEGSFEDSRVKVCSGELREFSVQDLVICSCWTEEKMELVQW